MRCQATPVWRLRTAAIAGLLCVSVVHAQNPTAPPAAEAPATTETIPVSELPESGQPAVAEVESGPTVLQDVVVTAQKRKQRLQDVPASVAVISGEQIQQRGMLTAEQVTRSMPNVTVNTENLLGVYTIRGMGAATAGFFDPSVSAVVDDVPLPVSVINFAFLDLASVELLRGPQGTLFGKNTVAGAIKLSTQEPGDEFGGSGNVNIGSYHRQRVEAVAGIPLIEGRAGLRARYSDERRDGYIRNTYRNEDNGRISKSGLGAKLRLDLSSSLSLTTNVVQNTVDYLNGYGYQAVVCPDYYISLARTADPEFECEANKTSSTDYNETSKGKAFLASTVLSWRPGDYEFKSFLSYYRYTAPTDYDADYTPLPLLTLPLDLSGRSLSSEIRLISPRNLQFLGRKFSFVTGLFVNGEHADQNDVLQIAPLPCAFAGIPVTGGLFGGLGIPGLNTGALTCSPDDPQGQTYAETLALIQNRYTREMAVFGQAEYELINKLTLTVGARYSHVRTVGEHLENRDTCAGLPQGCVGAAGGYQNASFDGVHLTDSAISTKLALAYAVSKPLRTYISYATGFKPGGYALGIFADENGDPQPDSYQPEHSVSYEVGAKLNLFGGLVRVNAAAFRSDYKNLQVLVNHLVGAEQSNAGSARTQGGELETLFILPSSWLTMRLALNGGYVDARYRNYQGAPCPASESGEDDDGNPQTPAVCDLSGRQLANAPRWKASSILDFDIPLGSWPVMLTVGGDANWQSRVFFQSDTDPNDTQPAYWFYNLRAGVADAADRWRLSFFIDNLADKTYLQTSNDISLVNGAHWGSVGAPRWYSVGFRYSF